MKHAKIGHKLGVAFSVMTLVAIAISAFVFMNLFQIRKATGWSDHTYQVLAQIDKAGAAMVD